MKNGVQELNPVHRFSIYAQQTNISISSSFLYK